MVLLKIDGQAIKVEEKTTILQAARQNSLFIPNLCFHPDLPPGGVCGLCVVEIDGMDGCQRACITEATEGMEVHTSSPGLTKLRLDNLGKILALHPHACLACDLRDNCDRLQCSKDVPEAERCCFKLGSCQLQYLVGAIGWPENLPAYQNKGLPVNEDKPLFRYDYNLCIGCGRCIRACRDLRGVEALRWTADFQIVDAEPGGALFDGYTSPEQNLSSCRFCGACVEVCPTGAIMEKGGKTTKEAEQFQVPCRYACPAGVDVPRYVRSIAEGRPAEAVSVIREKVAFPAVLGYICAHPCESACRRGLLNEAIAIQALKRYAADTAGSLEPPAPRPGTGKKVAVVGSGPAGLSAAYYLRQQGHAVTILESQPKLGGMLRYGIPRYRLPDEVAAREIQAIIDTGVEVRTGVKVGHDLSLDDLRKSYDASFLAVGANLSRRINLEGSEAEGVLWGVEFLREASQGLKPVLGARVVVVGGGNVAIDVARSALRLGAKEVKMACLESRDEMPAHPWEIKEALEEGVVMEVSWGPKEILTSDNQVTGIAMRRCTAVFDAERRFNPCYDDGTTLVLECETVILAIGQASDLSLLEGSGIQATPRGTIPVDASCQTTTPGIFAAGDAVRGPASVVEAAAAGREAARSIDRFLGGSGDLERLLVSQEKPSACLGKIENFYRLARQAVPCAPPADRKNDFQPVELGYSQEEALAEARRCLQCDLRPGLAWPWCKPC